MENKEYLQFCRYYKGEKDNPFEEDSVKAMLWDYEEIWVEMETTNDTEYLSMLIKDYVRDGLSDFEKNDNTPMTLKALLYNRYSHWNEDDGFKKWYKEVYMK